MGLRPREDKLARLIQRADKGRHFADFATDPFICQFFDDLEARLIDDLSASASTLSPDSLRAVAVTLKTARALRQFITEAASSGVRAEEKYTKLIQVDK